MTRDNARPAYQRGLRTWIDGELYADPAYALVPATDHGLVAGDGVFEVLKLTVDGPFAVTRHLARLARSAERLGLLAPDLDLIRRGLKEVCADLSGWEQPHGRIRITYTGGLGPLSSARTSTVPMTVISAEPSAPSTATGRIVTLPWTRNPNDALTFIKSTSYGGNVRGLAYAAERGCGEGIFVNTDDHVAEGTGTNLFVVRDGRVVTPPIAAGVLDGITRALVLEWCDEVEERNLTLEEAQAADEVFITSTNRDVQAIERWDEITWPAPGPVTERIRGEFLRRAAQELDP
jgi:branched-chain amino acid aminotransferase